MLSSIARGTSAARFVRIAPTELWSDRPLVAAALAAFAANLAIYAYVWSVQPSLPELMPLHYNGAGVVDMIGRPLELFKLPIFASVILVLNVVFGVLLHRRERPGAHLLVWTALAVQLVFGSGAWVLVQRAAGD